MQVTIDGVAYEPVAEKKVEEHEVLLSVLVPSVASRRNTFAPKIMDRLFTQHELLTPEAQRRVEILVLTDAKGMLVGDKRNAMVRMARGKYVVFVDDDDRVSDEYIELLLNGIKSDPDCVTFKAQVTLNGSRPKDCHYSITYERDENHANGYSRIPNHICAVRRILALSTPFPSKQCGEDSDYAVRLKSLLKTECYIDRTLYFYDYSDATTETQGKRNEPKIMGSEDLGRVLSESRSPLVDVIIISKATTPELRAMTQKAIDTCATGATPYVINVIVMESENIGKAYDGATTVVNQAGTFNYNRSANEAAARGSAEWIMIANNDLIFEDGWLVALLGGERDCVSPIDPNSRVQRNIRHNEAGWIVGRNFSGWCFMLKRATYEKIGKFDESVTYWCSDNIVVEQLRAINIMPMVVPTARVQHLGSITGGKQPPDALGWANVEIFNEKYPQRPLFVNDARYMQYLRTRKTAA